MPHRAWDFRVEDIVAAINAILEYTYDMNLDQFILDRKTVDAVMRNLIVIGEAASHIPEEICLKHPEIPWYEMRGMRNFIIHEYFKTSDKILWDTVTVNLPPVLPMLKELLK